MLFEPTPVQTSRSGRLRTAMAVAMPVVMLVAVVGVALAGTEADRATTEPSRAVQPSAEASGPAAALPGPDKVTAVDASARFPTRVFGLSIESVDEALDRRAGRSPDEIVAIGGWFTFRPFDARCTGDKGAVPAALAYALCWESGLLADDPAPALRWDGDAVNRIGPNGPHLHPQIAPGVALWGLDAVAIQPAGSIRTDGPIPPVAVVVVGRFDDPRIPGCAPSGRHCGESFAIESIVWTEGWWRNRPVIEAIDPVDGGLDSQETRRIAFQALPGQHVLSQALLPASMLARIDATAVEILPPTALETTDRLWYLRVMLPAPDDAGPAWSMGWLAVDDATGAILGSAPSR